MPPARPAKTTVRVTRPVSTRPLAIVAATPSDRNAPTRLRMPDRPTATRGLSAFVAIEVAMALPVSWNPLVKSKPRAVTTTRTSSKSFPRAASPPAFPVSRCSTNNEAICRRWVSRYSPAIYLARTARARRRGSLPCSRQSLPDGEKMPERERDCRAGRSPPGLIDRRRRQWPFSCGNRVIQAAEQVVERAVLELDHHHMVKGQHSGRDRASADLPFWHSTLARTKAPILPAHSGGRPLGRRADPGLPAQQRGQVLGSGHDAAEAARGEPPGHVGGVPVQEFRATRMGYHVDDLG